MAANQLARFDVPFIIIDKKSGPTRESRAIAVTARSMEIYQQMGLDKKAIEGGKKITEFNLFSGGKPRARVKIGEVGKGISEFSYMLAFEQSKNEELLNENLERMGREVLWDHEFISLEDYKEKIEVIVRNQNEEISIQAKYLIACDGASSPVRTQLNFSFKGGTYKHKFFVADTVIGWEQEYNKLIIAPGHENFCAFLPMHGEKNYRVIGTMPKEYFGQEAVTFHDIEDVVKATLGIPLQFESVNWFSTYKLHHRGVEQFKLGNVFLAGDSAHIHSPAGGQGMNTGLQDAYNLCWKLAFVVKGLANESLLDTYNEERLPFAKALLKFTDRGFNAMTSQNWFIRLFRKIVVMNLAGMMTQSGFLKPLMFRILSQVWYSYKGLSLSMNGSNQNLKFHAGDRLPYFEEDNIYDRFTEAAFHLLHIHHETITEPMMAQAKATFSFPIRIVEDQQIQKWSKLGVKKELFILVRPDNYIAYILDNMNESTLSTHLKLHFTSYR